MDFGNIIRNLLGNLNPDLKLLVDEYQKLMADGKIDGNDSGEIIRLLEEFAKREGIDTTLVDKAMKFLNK